jgi:uncharacterized membrane protein
VSDAPERPRLPLTARIVIGALAVIGVLAVVQWTISALFGVVRIGVVLVVIVVVAALMLRGRSGAG